MAQRALSDQQLRQWNEDGYVIVENVLSQDEVDFVLQVAHADPQLAADTKANQNYEGDGLKTVLAYRPWLGDDIYSAYAASERVVRPMEELLGGEVFHYYTLIMQKDPQTGGWQYHQDYGYHYKQFLFPGYASCMLALNPATRENGCLRVYKGSNRLGRLDHQGSGQQLIADPTRVALAAKVLEEVYCELKPGSVLYFHGNTLHASDPNRGTVPRWGLVLSYAAAANVCVDPNDKSSQYAYLKKLDDREVQEVAQRHWRQVQQQLAAKG